MLLQHVEYRFRNCVVGSFPRIVVCVVGINRREFVVVWFVCLLKCRVFLY